jgi:hypothetical protein
LPIDGQDEAPAVALLDHLLLGFPENEALAHSIHTELQKLPISSFVALKSWYNGVRDSDIKFEHASKSIVNSAFIAH